MGEIAFDPENPLGRLPGESLRANQALRDYALLGAGRSQRKLFEQYRQQNDSKTTAEKTGLRQPGSFPTEPPAKRLRTLAEWSSQFAWQERVEAWERLTDAADEQLWVERRRQLREDEWEISEELLELAKAILAEGPKFIKTKKRIVPHTGQEIITMALDARLAIQAAAEASKQRRLAAGIETDRVFNDRPSLFDDLKGLSEDELDQLIRNLQEAIVAPAGSTESGTSSETPPGEAEEA